MEPNTIKKTYLYNFDPRNPVVKQGFTEVYTIFLVSPKKIYVLSRNKKHIRIFIWKLSVFDCEFFQYIWIGVFS